jgi:hypothetical protein
LGNARFLPGLSFAAFAAEGLGMDVQFGFVCGKRCGYAIIAAGERYRAAALAKAVRKET